MKPIGAEKATDETNAAADIGKIMAAGTTAIVVEIVKTEAIQTNIEAAEILATAMGGGIMAAANRTMMAAATITTK